MPPDIATDANASQPMLDPANVGIINKVTENSPVPTPADLGPLSAPTGLATAAAQPAPPPVPLHSRIADGIIHAFAGTNGTPGDALRSALAGGLAGLAAAARTPRKPGDPIGSGIGIGAGAAMEDAQKRQAIQQQQKQQQFENQQNQQKLDTQTKMDQAITARTNVDRIHSQMLLHQTSDAAVDASIEHGKAALKAITTAPDPGQILHSDGTKNELETKLAQEHIDPTTGTFFPTGKRDTGQKGEDGLPIQETTFSWATLPKEMVLDKDSLKPLEGIPDFKKYTPGTAMSGPLYNKLYQQADDIRAATEARNHTLVQNKLATDAEARAMEKVDIGPEWDKAMAHNNNNPEVALRVMQKDPELVTKYPHLSDDVMAAYGGPAKWEDLKNKQAELKIKQQEQGQKELQNSNDPAAAEQLGAKLVEATDDPTLLNKRAKNYDATLIAADNYSMKKYGKPFDIAQAVTDYKFANSTQTQNTLKYLNSLTGSDNKSGNLGALVDQSNKISRTQFPSLNDASAWARLATGDPAMAAYHATVTEVADQVAKIMQGGGAGTSDAKMKQAQDLFKTGFSKGQISEVAGTLRTLLANRKTELVGGNRYLQKQFGAPNAASPQKPPNLPAGVIWNADGNGGKGSWRLPQ